MNRCPYKPLGKPGAALVPLYHCKRCGHITTRPTAGACTTPRDDEGPEEVTPLPSPDDPAPRSASNEVVSEAASEST